jgi:hypothetical protein
VTTAPARHGLRAATWSSTNPGCVAVLRSAPTCCVRLHADEGFFDARSSPAAPTTLAAARRAVRTRGCRCAVGRQRSRPPSRRRVSAAAPAGVHQGVQYGRGGSVRHRHRAVGGRSDAGGGGLARGQRSDRDRWQSGQQRRRGLRRSLRVRAQRHEVEINRPTSRRPTPAPATPSGLASRSRWMARCWWSERVGVQLGGRHRRQPGKRWHVALGRRVHLSLTAAVARLGDARVRVGSAA